MRKELAEEYYSRPEIQKAILNFAKDREIAVMYAGYYGKRPDVIEYLTDVKNFVKNGAFSFHCSEELWHNPLNIVTGMTILVKNKTKEIAIFNTLGMSKFSISKIFFIMGSFIGISGTIFGVILGVVFAHNIEAIRQFVSFIFQVKVFPPEIYFLSKMPSLIDYKSVLIICFFSVLITFFASLYPAISASKLNPIKGLKYD